MLFALAFVALITVSKALCPGQSVACTSCSTCSSSGPRYRLDSHNGCSPFFWQCVPGTGGATEAFCQSCPIGQTFQLTSDGGACVYAPMSCFQTTTRAPATTPRLTTPTPTAPLIPTYNTCGAHVDVTLSSSSPLLIESPNYPSSYPNNSTCVWHLHAHSRGYNSVNIASLAFDLETTFDYLIIETYYSNRTYHRYSGTARPNHQVVINLQNLPKDDYKITLKTDNSVTKGGFALSVSASQTAPVTTYPLAPCSSSTTPYSISTGFGLTMQSPNFNVTNYEGGLRCGWYLSNRGSSTQQIALSFDAFNTESCCDKLYIYNSNNTQIFRFSGTQDAGRLIGLPVNSRSFYILFRTDGSIGKTGFSIRAGLAN